MSYTALLISEQRLKQWTNLDDNVRVADITPFIINAQSIYVQDRLGTKFFNRIKEGIIADNLNADEQTLLNDYIGPMLSHYALYLMLPGLKYKFVDKGILSGTSEETAPTSGGHYGGSRALHGLSLLLRRLSARPGHPQADLDVQ